ncbi:rCG60531 [Rattus norvegicus]|uniref:RCG60531 n=1 Tax=Rattus norvegicus TaxID=10116 RepID=A6JKX9_RAT|nr:rCG60531 [Rattus norvegicus]
MKKKSRSLTQLKKETYRSLTSWTYLALPNVWLWDFASAPSSC